MENDLLQTLFNGTENEISSALNQFTTKHAKTFVFPHLNNDDKKRLVEGIYRKLILPESSLSRTCRLSCLETLRCLSRDKQGLEEVFSKDLVDHLVRTAGLLSCEEVLQEEGKFPQPDNDFAVILEAQKVLCNLIYNCSAIQRICSSNSCIEGIMLRLKTYSDTEWPHDIKFFDMRMLFLITALCADVRPRLRSEFHGLIYLMEILDLIIKWNMENALNKLKDSGPGGKRRFNRSSKRGWEQNGRSNVPCLMDEEADLAVEVLKVLYNLTVSFDRGKLEEEDLPHFQRLVCILHDILLCGAKSEEKRELLQSKTVELLSNMPPPSYEELLTPQDEIQPKSRVDNKEFDFYGMNVEALSVLLDFLGRKLEQIPESLLCSSRLTPKDFTVDAKQNKTGCSLTENLSPILVCLREMACANGIIRRFFRSKILPPLKDVMNRPEEGDALRNKLVRLMTSPMTMVKQLVAELLFVLCKENVGRLVKYTGYGNAAGLLANRGLMLGNNPADSNPQYSSDSEDSDTEEYTLYRSKINPVTGCYEEPGPNPMEGMTDEQKEFEAVQLVNMIDKLSRDGLMKPMRVGADGRPHPVEHVLELQEEEIDKK